MLEFRYKDKHNWYRGNTHLHSVKSDGSKNFDELAVLYKEKGYDFLFRTDHWVCSDVEADKADYPLLWLDGDSVLALALWSSSESLGSHEAYAQFDASQRI